MNVINTKNRRFKQNVKNSFDEFVAMIVVKKVIHGILWKYNRKKKQTLRETVCVKASSSERGENELWRSRVSDVGDNRLKFRLNKEFGTIGTRIQVTMHGYI